MDPLGFLAAASLLYVGASFGLMAAWCGSMNDLYLRSAGGSLALGFALLALFIALA